MRRLIVRSGTERLWDSRRRVAEWTPYAARIMRTLRRRIATALALVPLLAVPACTSDRNDLALNTAQEFLSAWAAGDDEAAAALTDDQAAAQAQLTEVREALRITAADIDARPSTGDADDADAAERTIPYRAALTLASLGEWSYEGQLSLRRIQEEGQTEDWEVIWTPAVIHPRLTPQTRLSRVRDLPQRAPVLDRAGRPLMEERPVVFVGIEPQRLTDPTRVYATLAGRLGVDSARLQERVAAAKPDAFVDVITLREADYGQVAVVLESLDGVVTRAGTRTLAPTATFARQVLGSVGPATEEALANAGDAASQVDEVGLSGLQFAYQQQLAGTASGRVVLLDRQNGQELEVLGEISGTGGTPLQTSLDLGVQSAAEAALAQVPTPAAIVAVDAASGAILAAANGPAASDGVDRALDGRYPPGSTFKVVTTAALVGRGLDPEAAVPCPAEVSVSGKRFGNAGGVALGDVPFSTAFTRSCNTAFVSLADDLPPEALPETARFFGLGSTWELGVRAFPGEVPAPTSDVERAAAAIGQAKTLASPLAMALVAATVQSGQFRAPVLLPDQADGDAAAVPPLDGRIADTLRSLMTRTVQEGTASALQQSATPVAAKTGTAEFGTETPPRTHAWMIGYRGELAFAVLLEDGGAGGADAGPVAAAFLAGVPDSP
jgi:cell division protein FtsI/penicillin-binding protein 2